MRAFFGEFLGTFILVFVGCGTVAIEVLFGVFGHIIPIALMWGGGVALAIFASRKWCPAHLNPAVSMAFWLTKEISTLKLLLFTIAQFIGAFVSALFLYLIFNNSILEFEPVKTVATAKMFGEYYSVDTSDAFLYELVGTAFLVMMIFWIVTKVTSKNLIPVLIGLVVSIAIVFIAPYTQCGINPARDFAPRLFSYLMGWERAAFYQEPIKVYVIAPFFGAGIGCMVFFYIKKAFANN